MKKRVGAFLLAAALTASSLSMGVGAVEWSGLQLSGIYKYGEPEYAGGIMCVPTDNGWNYINENGAIVDMNEGRFAYMFPFSEDMAAVIDFNGKLGYINRKGNLVIECQYGVYFDQDDIYTGYYKNGMATVFQETYRSDGAKAVMAGKINKYNQLVYDFTEVKGGLDELNLVADNSHRPGVSALTRDELDPHQPSSWALDEVISAKLAGLMTGSTYGNFQANITRLQFASLAVNLAERVTGKEITPASSGTFNDTQSEIVRKAFAAGIVDGLTPTTFGPTQTITREQMATMLNRAINYIEKTKGSALTGKNADLSPFSDRAAVSEYAKTAVGILVNNGVMAGTSKTELSPKGTATVEQSLLMIYRLYQVVNK